MAKQTSKRRRAVWGVRCYLRNGNGKYVRSPAWMRRGGTPVLASKQMAEIEAELANSICQRHGIKRYAYKAERVR